MYKIGFVGGHLTPAVAVMQELLCGGYGFQLSDFVFFGRREEIKRTSVEYQTINEMGVTFVDVRVPKINRFFSLHNFGSCFLIPFSYLQVFFKVLKNRPRVILAFGAYLSVPVCVSAAMLGSKVVLFEGTAVAGRANRLLKFCAAKILISFARTRHYFPSAILVGCPLRREIIEQKSVASQIPLLLICGGHLGSRAINQAILPLIPKLLDNFIVVHQTGKYDFNAALAVKNSLAVHRRIRYELSAYFNAQDYGHYLVQAELVVGRAGANSVAEILYHNKKAILIPLPFSEYNEQFENARIAQDQGLVTIIEQKDLTPNLLLKKINLLRQNKDLPRINEYQSLFKNSATQIAQQLKELIG